MCSLARLYEVWQDKNIVEMVLGKPKTFDWMSLNL